VLAAAAELGARRVTLEVRSENAAAIALYESVGLGAVGTRPGYYGYGQDAVIMWGDLPGVEPTVIAVGPDELILAIESSCDETAAAVMRGGRELLANVVASQIDFHARFGGVVPEIASRKHTEAIVGVIDEAMERAGVTLGLEGPLHFAELDAIAVTHAPGLIGALVVGVAYAKGLAMATGKPLIGVNHLEGHIFANVFADPEVKPPLVALLVSGGHTSLVHMPEWGVYRTMGETLDDAAGEAFDKVAKVLGLGYPGGPILSKLAEQGDPAAINFPRAMMKSGDYAFSLSGLKTAVLTYIRHEEAAGREVDVPNLAASFQQAVIDVQVSKAVRAVQETGAVAFCLGGGVAANRALREALSAAIEPLGVHVSVPPLELCTDNAAMIAAAAHYRYLRGERLGLDAEPSASMRLDTA
jgi:N6-L-threonylcarbamoyladenine synthase/protein kinase Bud32